MSAVAPRVRIYLEFARPFTLFAPALGMASGGATAIGAAPAESWRWALVAYPALGAVMAAVLNAASNGLNQIFDLEIDRVNKPKRPLPSGRLSIAEAWVFTIAAFVAAWMLAWLIAPDGRHECFWLVVGATVITSLYSVPPFRTKRLGIWANLTIAVPRGAMLKVAGWSTVKTIIGVEPWYIGTIFGLFLLGATTTKDFADMDGDRDRKSVV
jgi:4-hydroxybenzoate polyprenyltransferase